MLSVYKTAALILLGATPLWGHSQAHAATLLNGDMEDWPSSCPVNTPPTGWSNFHAGTPVLGADQGGICIGPDAFDGDSFMNLVWSDAGFQEGSQYDFTDLVPGIRYRVDFYGRNSDGTYASTGGAGIDLYHNGSVIFSTPELVSPGAWALYSQSFTAVTATDSIGFRVAPGGGTSGSVGVDAVSITEVYCPDYDGDGICNADDLCEGDDASGDTDADGVCNDTDICPIDLFDDSDGDGFCDSMDLCDGDDFSGDSDGDAICNDTDFLLLTTAARIGQPLSLRVVRAVPGSTVSFYGTARGLGNEPCLTGGACGLLDSPVRIGQVVADSNGVATLTRTLPNSFAEGILMLFQAASDGPLADLTQAEARRTRR